MANRAFQFQNDQWYHVYNRGCNKQQLFFEDRDFERFLKNISRYQEQFPSIEIGVWCMLPNHFHFLIRSPSSSSNSTKYGEKQSSNLDIPKFMQKLQQAYAMFFNTKYGDKVKKGQKAPVFEGRFGAREITDDEYLEQVAQYIRDNAVHHELVENVEDWVWAGADLKFGQSSGSVLSDSFSSPNSKNLENFDPGFE